MALMMLWSRLAALRHARKLSMYPDFIIFLDIHSLRCSVVSRVPLGMDDGITDRRNGGVTYYLRVGRNVCHGSDSTESAENEIKLWFPE